ncbi:CHAP domain-containing protein [Bacillus sp. 491mf]|uniref:CHAP domain-containing protein n=1 Tax=Bacillus sp. 491mf TaxID=1761755 RepID=UPI0008EA3156|nr:CHAP domain-containing protein [Bacillus sp. 491mf]SFC56111.1 CHAP domain-containing protein [Bacillus sp. 491mf]
MKSSRHRLESIRVLVNEILDLDSGVNRQKAYAQLNGVSSFASMLAMKRGLETEIAAITGLLHNYYFYKTGISYFPGINSAETVRPIIRDLNIFSKDEQLTILRAIFYQNQRGKVHGPYDELIKDAIMLNNFFQNLDHTVSHMDVQRFHNVFGELSIPKDQFEEVVPTNHNEKITKNEKDKRSLLADISEELASQNIIGIPENKLYTEICHYWPDPDIYKVLQGNWCAAFVYHCCMQAGILLPIRYPNGNYRLAGVGAIFEWALLPETGFFYYDDQNSRPQRGDIVIYEKLLSNNSHDHIGIVLDREDQEILVAEGNRDNENYSSVFRRCRDRNILGYIRIDNEYEFHFDGDYNPII